MLGRENIIKTSEGYQQKVRKAATAGAAIVLALLILTVLWFSRSIDVKNALALLGMFSTKQGFLAVGKGVPVYLGVVNLIGWLGLLAVGYFLGRTFGFYAVIDESMSSYERAQYEIEETQRRIQERESAEQMRAQYEAMNQQSVQPPNIF